VLRWDALEAKIRLILRTFYESNHHVTLSTTPCLLLWFTKFKPLASEPTSRLSSHAGESFANVNFVLRRRCFPSQIQVHYVLSRVLGSFVRRAETISYI